MIVLPVLIQNIIEIANIIIEIALIFHYFSLLSEKKNNWALMILSYFSAAVLLSVSVFLSGNFMVNFLSTAVVLTLISFLNFEDKFTRRIFLIFIYLLIISIADPIVIGILCVANAGVPNEFLQSSAGRYLGMMGTDIIYLWFTIFTNRLINKKVRELPLRYWLLIIVIPVFSIFILQFMIDSIAVHTGFKGYFVLFLAIGGIIYINITMFHFFESYEDKIKLEYLEMIQDKEQENYNLLALTHKQIREFKHDIENQFSVLHDLMESGDIEEALKYLDKLGTFVKRSNRLCHTGNNAVDSIVNTKGALAITHNIDFICRVNITSEIKADAMELCRILGNGLDNAIEGCDRAGTSDTHILLSISEDKENLLISISNTSIQVDTTNLSTSKKKTGLHGIGVKSIKSSVERLNGVVKFNYKDGVFKLNIVVRNSSLI